MAERQTVFGIYAKQSQAECAVDSLLRGGFSAAEISVLLPEQHDLREPETEKSTMGSQGVTAGASAGAVLGGTLGLLAGIGALAIPGVGPLIAAGPLLATLTGIGLGGAVGGFAGALIGLGIPESEAKRYEGFLQSGGTLLSVHCENPEQVDRARQILRETGAEEISSTDEPVGQRDRASGAGAGQ